jgi:hypothetical protein
MTKLTKQTEAFMLYTRKNAQVDAILMKTGLNNVLLPTLFIVVNNSERYIYIVVAVVEVKSEPLYSWVSYDVINLTGGQL